MKNLYISILFLLLVLPMAAQNAFQLAPPLLKYTSVFFSKEANIEMVFAEANTQIRYTLNGQEPTEKALRYKAPLRITENFTTLKARVFGQHFLSSDIVQATFIKDGLPIKSVESTKPNEKYKGSGATTLIDNKGGHTGISGNTWLGFQTDTIEVILNLNKKENCKRVLINLLRDYGSWIFLPEKIEFFTFNNKIKSFQFIENQEFIQEKNIEGAACVPFVFLLKKGIKTDKIKLRLYLVKKLPDWHAGKGNKGWIFIDEIKVYRK